MVRLIDPTICMTKRLCFPSLDLEYIFHILKSLFCPKNPIVNSRPISQIYGHLPQPNQGLKLLVLTEIYWKPVPGFLETMFFLSPDIGREECNNNSSSSSR